MKRCSEDTGKIQRKTLREEEDGQTDALLNGGTSLIRINSSTYSWWLSRYRTPKMLQHL